MNEAIVIEALSKRYRIGEHQQAGMLREALVSLLKRPFRKPVQVDPERSEVWALRDVSCTIRKGEVVGVIGRNGSGKTTLLKLLSRITRPTSGTIDVRGRVASLVEVGTGFHNELTGRENVYLNGSILGLRRREIEERFDDIVEFSGVERFIDTPIKRYSTGMRLRLGFAVAAHLSPDVLLVDEVLAVGDVQFQNQCLDTLGRVGQDGRTVLFVSHHLEAIERLCPRTIWIDGGHLRQDGPTRDVLDAYVATMTDTPSATLDLRTSNRRSGTGEARFTGMDLLDAGGAVKEVVRCGDDLTLRLHLHVEQEVRRPYLGVMISTDLGTLVAHPNTWSAESEEERIDPGDLTVELRLRGLPLLPGRYAVTLWCNRYGDDHSVDLLEHCHVLHVRPSEDGREGRVLERRAGIVCLDATWGSFAPTDDASTLLPPDTDSGRSS